MAEVSCPAIFVLPHKQNAIHGVQVSSWSYDRGTFHIPATFRHPYNVRYLPFEKHANCVKV